MAGAARVRRLIAAIVGVGHEGDGCRRQQRCSAPRPGTVEPDIVDHHGDHWLAIGNHRNDCVFLNRPRLRTAGRRGLQTNRDKKTYTHHQGGQSLARP